MHEDNQDLSNFELDTKVTHTPGHSKGSISIITEERNLFIGDIIGNTKNQEKTALIDDVDQLNTRIEKIKASGIFSVHLFSY